MRRTKYVKFIVLEQVKSIFLKIGLEELKTLMEGLMCPFLMLRDLFDKKLMGLLAECPKLV